MIIIINCKDQNMVISRTQIHILKEGGTCKNLAAIGGGPIASGEQRPPYLFPFCFFSTKSPIFHPP